MVKMNFFIMLKWPDREWAHGFATGFFHEMRISWTELAVKRIIGLIMTPEPCRENAARVPVVQLRPNPKLRLRDPFHEVARFQHLSLRSETTYGEWVVRHLEFHKERRGCPRC